MTQAPITANLSTFEQEVDPFADFRLLLQGHLTGGRIPEGRKVLLELLTFISSLDEETAFGIVKQIAEERFIDTSATQTSLEAFDLVVPS